MSLTHTYLALLEVRVIPHVMRQVRGHVARVMSAPVARREGFTQDYGDLMRLHVVAIVRHLVDAGGFALLSGPVFSCHDNVPLVLDGVRVTGERRLACDGPAAEVRRDTTPEGGVGALTLRA